MPARVGRRAVGGRALQVVDSFSVHCRPKWSSKSPAAPSAEWRDSPESDRCGAWMGEPAKAPVACATMPMKAVQANKTPTTKRTSLLGVAGSASDGDGKPSMML